MHIIKFLPIMLCCTAQNFAYYTQINAQCKMQISCLGNVMCQHIS